MKLIIDNKNLKKYILENYDQEELFSFYLCIPVSEISESLHKKVNIINPLRSDNIPSLSFYYSGDSLKMWDYGDAEFRIDIFDLVGIIYGKPDTRGKNFIWICNKIIEDISESSTSLGINRKIIEHREKFQKKTYFYKRNWLPSDELYWSKYRLSIEFLEKRYLYPVSSIIMNSTIIYNYTQRDRCYAYYIGKSNHVDLWKYMFVDRPNNKIGMSKYITNSKLKLECLFNLKPTNTVIITEGRKDALSLEATLSDFFFFGEVITCSIVNLASASNFLSANQIELFNSKYKSRIMIVDNDEAGYKCKEYHESKGFVVFVPDKENDISELRKKDLDYLKSWIKNDILNYIV